MSQTPFIQYGKQCITPADIDAVVAVLKSSHLTQGPAITRFERSLAEKVGARHAVAVNSATAGLHIACLAAGLKSGDEHWTVPNTFVASANCGLYCGARVDFVDIDPKTYNMCPQKLEDKLKAADRAGRLPKTLVPVAFAGQSAPMAEIYQLAQKYGVTVIEDASHGIGGKYKGEFLGSNRYTDMTVFSFHPVKIITTGEGGLVTTNRDDLNTRMQMFRSHGITRDDSLLQSKSDGPWYYEQLELGYNYRTTDIHAALGWSQLQRLEEFVQRRKQLVARYNQLFADLPVLRPHRLEENDPAWHLYVLHLDYTHIRGTRLDVYQAMNKRGIQTNVHYIPVHTQPYYQRLGFRRGDFPVAEMHYQQALSIPLYFELTDQQQDHVVNSLRELFA